MEDYVLAAYRATILLFCPLNILALSIPKAIAASDNSSSKKPHTFRSECPVFNDSTRVK